MPIDYAPPRPDQIELLKQTHLDYNRRRRERDGGRAARQRNFLLEFRARQLCLAGGTSPNFRVGEVGCCHPAWMEYREDARKEMVAEEQARARRTKEEIRLRYNARARELHRDQMALYCALRAQGLPVPLNEQRLCWSSFKKDGSPRSANSHPKHAVGWHTIRSLFDKTQTQTEFRQMIVRRAFAMSAHIVRLSLDAKNFFARLLRFRFDPVRLVALDALKPFGE
jgi:hypothetical protein